MNRHEKLPPLEQLKEHSLDYNHKLIDLANHAYELAHADECHPDEVKIGFDYVYDCLQSLKHAQEAIIKIVLDKEEQNNAK